LIFVELLRLVETTQPRLYVGLVTGKRWPLEDA
jgi:hypothetical protein